MARLYADENFPLPVVDILRKAGYDILTSRDAGNAGRSVPDDEVFDFATAENRAILTFNRRHFVKLHARRPQHSGMVVCTFDPDFQALAGRIDAVLRTASLKISRVSYFE